MISFSALRAGRNSPLREKKRLLQERAIEAERRYRGLRRRCRATRIASAGLRSAAEPLPALPPLQPVCAYPPRT